MAKERKTEMGSMPHRLFENDWGEGRKTFGISDRTFKYLASRKVQPEDVNPVERQNYRDYLTKHGIEL